jgi:hypothetical protein
MQQNFTQIDNLIVKWSEGRYAPSDTSPQPPAHVAQGGTQQHRVSDKPPIDRRRHEDVWELYVRRFGDAYSLTPAQRNAAHGILQDCRGKAQGYRDTRKKEFDATELRLKDALRAPNSSARLIELRGEQAELEQPIADIFSDLKRRLEQIPGKAQHDGVKPEQVASLEALAKACIPIKPVQTPTTVGPAEGEHKPRARKAATPGTTQPVEDDAASTAPAEITPATPR